MLYSRMEHAHRKIEHLVFQESVIWCFSFQKGLFTIENCIIGHHYRVLLMRIYSSSLYALLSLSRGIYCACIILYDKWLPFNTYDSSFYKLHCLNKIRACISHDKHHSP